MKNKRVWTAGLFALILAAGCDNSSEIVEGQEPDKGPVQEFTLMVESNGESYLNGKTMQARQSATSATPKQAINKVALVIIRNDNSAEVVYHTTLEGWNDTQNIVSRPYADVSLQEKTALQATRTIVTLDGNGRTILSTETTSETERCFSIIRNRLYTIGTKSHSQTYGTDEPVDLSEEACHEYIILPFACSVHSLYHCMEKMGRHPEFAFTAGTLPSDILAWDMSRLILLVRLCLDCGYMSEQEAWEHILLAGGRIWRPDVSVWRFLMECLAGCAFCHYGDGQRFEECLSLAEKWSLFHNEASIV